MYLDHAAFPGSSGSALWNTHGEVVGVIESNRVLGDETFKLGYGQAVPAAIAQQFIAKNMTSGTIKP